MHEIARRSLLLAAASAALAGPAVAQQYPSKPVKLIWNYAAGGPGDAITRLLAASMSNHLGQQVVVENRTGASGAVGALAVQRSAPDGYTLLLTTITTIVQLPLVTKDASFDPVRSMVPIMNLGMAPLAILANPSVPANDFPSFVEWARKQPAGVDVATAGPTLEVASSLLSQQAKIKLVNVAYRGGAPALQAAVSGEVKIFFNTPSGTLTQYLNEGKLKLLGVTSAQPSPLLPGGVPISNFVPGYIQDINYAVWAPVGTPPEVLARIAEAIRKSASEPGLAEKFHGSGVTLALGGPEEVVRITQREAANIKKIMETTPVKFE